MLEDLDSPVSETLEENRLFFGMRIEPVGSPRSGFVDVSRYSPEVPERSVLVMSRPSGMQRTVLSLVGFFDS
jgi:hypothetical protein